MPPNISRIGTELFIGHIRDNKHSHDTIILCTLMEDLFGRDISDAEVAKVINIHEGAPIVAGSVGYMFFYGMAHPTECRYKKLEKFKTKLVARNGQRDYDDKEEMSAWVLYNETLTTANLIASNQLESASAGQQ